MHADIHHVTLRLFALPLSDAAYATLLPAASERPAEPLSAAVTVMAGLLGSANSQSFSAGLDSCLPVKVTSGRQYVSQAVRVTSSAFVAAARPATAPECPPARSGNATPFSAARMFAFASRQPER